MYRNVVHVTNHDQHSYPGWNRSIDLERYAFVSKHITHKTWLVLEMQGAVCGVMVCAGTPARSALWSTSRPCIAAALSVHWPCLQKLRNLKFIFTKKLIVDSWFAKFERSPLVFTLTLF